MCRKVRSELSAFYNVITQIVSVEASVDGLMKARCYNDEKMRDVLRKIGVVFISDMADLPCSFDFTRFRTFGEWGLYSETGHFRLAGRYIFPIRDFAGNVTALAGWNNCQPKYIVTPTYGFMRDAQFFNAEDCVSHISRGDRTVYLTEGFFDALALRSRGFCGLGNFGLYLNGLKASMLERFEKVVVIGDADTAGKKAYPYLDGSARQRGNQWHIGGVPCTFVKLRLPYVKDADDLIRYYDCDEDLYNLRFKGAVFTMTENPL